MHRGVSISRGGEPVPETYKSKISLRGPTSALTLLNFIGFLAL